MHSLDRRFLHGAYGTTLWLGGLIIFVLALTSETPVVLSFLVGLLMEVGLVMSQEYVVRRLFPTPEESGALNGQNVWTVLGLRYGITIAALYLLVHFKLMNPFAFLGGFLLLHGVIALRAVVLMVAKRAGLPNAPRPPH